MKCTILSHSNPISNPSFRYSVYVLKSQSEGLFLLKSHLLLSHWTEQHNKITELCPSYVKLGQKKIMACMIVAELPQRPPHPLPSHLNLSINFEHKVQNGEGTRYDIICT